jgi:3-deoxy-D-manno-octulosonic-acid transferase
MYFAYTVLVTVAAVLLLPYFAVRGMRQGKYWRSLRQRLGYLPAAVARRAPRRPGAVWIHAVSVGEALAALPLARRLKQRFPERRLVVSTTTDTGQRLVRERFDFADDVFYFPLDWPGPVRRVFRQVEPGVVVILENEIWPNFLREARRAGVPVIFINGRISARSFRRYRWVDGWLARVLGDAEGFLAQTEADAERFRALGAPAARVEVMGNLKYDLSVPAAGPLAGWLGAERERQDRRPVLVAGSVLAGEEEPVLAAFAEVRGRWPRALLVLAPRKPERFDAAARLAAGAGWRVVRRSAQKLDAPLPAADVFLLDTLGELAGLYRWANAVFVGGSLVPAGGHNVLEPAWFSCPPVFGPSMENFGEIAGRLLEAGAAVQVAGGTELARAWLGLLENEGERERMGRAARELVEQNAGATGRALDRIAAILDRPGRP